MRATSVRTSTARPQPYDATGPDRTKVAPDLGCLASPPALSQGWRDRGRRCGAQSCVSSAARQHRPPACPQQGPRRRTLGRLWPRGQIVRRPRAPHAWAGSMHCGAAGCTHCGLDCAPSLSRRCPGRLIDQSGRAAFVSARDLRRGLSDRLEAIRGRLGAAKREAGRAESIRLAVRLAFGILAV